MTISSGVRALATAALLLAGVTACANSDGGNPSPSPSTSLTSTSPTTTTTTTAPPSDSEKASEAASDVVRRYFATVDLLQQDSAQRLGKLRVVSISTQLTAQKHLIQGLRDQGAHQTGQTNVVELEVQSINLDNSNPSVGKVPTAQVDVCWDVRQVDVVDKNGKSVITSGRRNVGWTRYTVANYQWASNPTGGWRVAGGEDLRKPPCATS